MDVTVDIDDNEEISVTDETVEPDLPDRIAFAAEGIVRASETLLGEFEERSLNPVTVDVSVDGSRTVEVDLTGAASLWLENVDVGVKTPDVDDVTAGVDDVRPSSGDEESNGDAADQMPGSIAFTVEGAIVDVPEETVDAVADGPATFVSITFAVDDTVRRDGGAEDDELFVFSFLGYGIVVRRNGTIDVSSGESVTDIRPL